MKPVFQHWGTSDYRVKVVGSNGCYNEDWVRVTTYGKCRTPATSLVKAVPCPPGAARTTSDPLAYETLTVNTTFSADTFYHKVFTVPEGITLIIDSCEIAFSDSSQIIVEEGGKLLIRESWVHDCGGTYWLGINVTGDQTDGDQVYITGSVIENAQNGLQAHQTVGLTLDDNVFVGGDYGLDLSQSVNINIQNNRFHDMPTGIHTSESSGNAALINANLFMGVTTGMLFENDDHSNLDIYCNQINYSDYGIYASGTNLKDQGTSGMGTGNVFNSLSSYLNNQLRYDGTSMTYYCDPIASFTLSTGGGLTASASTAAANGDCPRFPAKQTLSGIPNGSLLSGVSDMNVSVYPNPFEDILTLDYSMPENVTEVTFRIVEAASGKIIYFGNLDPKQRSVKLINLALSAGMYILTVRANNGSDKNFKMIKIN